MEEVERFTRKAVSGSKVEVDQEIWQKGYRKGDICYGGVGGAVYVAKRRFVICSGRQIDKQSG